MVSIFDGEVREVGCNRQVAAGDRDNRAEVKAVAFDAVGRVAISAISANGVEVSGIVFSNGGELTGLDALEVLAHDEGLGEAAVVVAAEVDDLAVIVFSSAEGLVVLEFVGEDRLESAEVAGKSGGAVAVHGRGAFTTVVLVSGVFVEGVLDRSLETGELRGLVRDHVVVAVGRGEAEDVVVAAVEGISRGEDEVIRAGTRANAAHAAHGERTEVGVEGDGSFAVEDALFGLECAGIGLEAVFKLEADLEAVAEFFRALQAEAGGGGDAGVHGEVVDVSLGVVSKGLVRVDEARVDDAEEGHVSSGGIAGGNAENGERGERLLEHLYISPISSVSGGSIGLN